MKSGAVFGEISLLVTLARRVTVRAKTHVDIFYVTKQSLDAVLQHYPVMDAKIQTQGKERFGAILASLQKASQWYSRHSDSVLYGSAYDCRTKHGLSNRQFCDGPCDSRPFFSFLYFKTIHCRHHFYVSNISIHSFIILYFKKVMIYNLRYPFFLWEEVLIHRDDCCMKEIYVQCFYCRRFLGT